MKQWRFTRDFKRWALPLAFNWFAQDVYSVPDGKGGLVDIQANYLSVTVQFLCFQFDFESKA